jgi:hypothetical protein
MLDNCTQLIKFDKSFEDDVIAVEIRKSIQVVDYYTEEKNQNWLWFRWKIWEEICRQMPIKTRQPLWPFGKLVYYNKRFVFGMLDIWVAHYWYILNNGILYLENSYLEPYEYKIKNKITSSNMEVIDHQETIQKEKIINKEHVNTLKQKAESYKTNNFIHSKEFTEAKYNYLLEEESKFNVKNKNETIQRASKKHNIKKLLG